MLSKFVPKFVKNKVYSLAAKRFHGKWSNEFLNNWNEEFLANRLAIEDRIPKYDLEEKHIKNLTVLVDRIHLLKRLPAHSVCAEIGVNEGEFSMSILQTCVPEKLHLIDAWGDPHRYHDGLKLAVHEKFKNEISSGQVEINVGFSTEVLKRFPDKYFDWVYLDTDHTYLVTAEELKILKLKVKPDGIIAGHDYIIGNWVGNLRYGVIEAVHELCVKEGWELLFLTCETNQFRSFAIRKIPQ